MNSEKQLWIVAGGNGSGKSTFHRLFLAPRNINLVNADLIAKEIDNGNPEKISYEAAYIAGLLRDNFLYEGISFCFETVFSHVSKIDFVAKAKSMGYEIILVYIHLDTPELNEARVYQRIAEGGHAVPVEKIHSRIPRTMKHISTVLPLVDEARLLNNSSLRNPFQQVAIVRKGKKEILVSPVPDWVRKILMAV